jgi:hypothetical protein
MRRTYRLVGSGYAVSQVQGEHMIELKQEQPALIPNEMLMRVIQLNEAIVRQNALIVQAMTLPAMFIKKEEPQ